MPGSIYNNLYTNFIRSGFTKSFTHGYAQSVVAATHPHVLNPQNRPSFAARKRQSTNRLSRLQQLQSAFHTGSHHSSSLPVEHRHEKLPSSHAGLDAYFEHLQKKEAEGEEDNEWVQFQFQNRIEWKPSPASILLGSEARTTEANGAQAGQDGVGEAVFSEEEQAALAHIDAAIEHEIEARKHLEAVPEDDVLSSRIQTPVPKKVSEPATPISRLRTPASLGRSATPPVDPQSQSYADHLTKLSVAGRYAEIPAVFEAMLVASIRPLATSYNALLMAAIHLPAEKIEIVSKALDVYTDMMRRKVVPDSDTYNILVGLLAARSLEVSSLKKRLEDKRARYGGMEEPGKFMLASSELEHAILSEDDRLDLAIKLFKNSVTSQRDVYSPETYHQLISACAQSGRVSDMLHLYEHMETNKATPFAATFPAMITAFANCGDLVSAVECYNEYRTLAIANDNGEATLNDRLDSQVYASVINAYVVSDKLEGAMKFYKRIVQEYGARTADLKDAIINLGFVKGFIHRGIYEEALRWAQGIEHEARAQAMADLALVAADSGNKHIATAAFASLPINFVDMATPAMALLALSVRDGSVSDAWRYWQILNSPLTVVDASFIEPTAMFAVALIGSGQVVEGLNESEAMFHRIRQSNPDDAHLTAEVEEGADFVARYMAARGVLDPRELASQTSAPTPTFTTSPYHSATSISSYEDTFDPYAHNTDFKGSSLISDELEATRRGPKLNDALARFRNIRRAGRHPRYITYAKLISAAAREGKFDLCNDILNMARTDVPLLPQYAIVRYGWSSILDAMVGACLNLGRRGQAEQYHQELLDMGATPSANTFGLYITTLKESTKTFDEASEAVKIFQRAKAEGVDPSSFLYNALIGKLGKARRIDDCLFYFAEMRALGIKPTSVTYGTIVNALCRVSDEKFAEELFDEMEAMPNYKARPAPYNSMMQFFLTTKRDKSKVLAYYSRMQAKGISPTAHTYKLLVDTHATLEPVDMQAAEAVLDSIRASGGKPEPVHYASLIHARGCVLHDMAAARKTFDSVINDPTLTASASLFQALFESMVANHCVADTEPLLMEMRRRRVDLTPYIANTLIHGWASEGKISRSEDIYGAVGRDRREPSTYEAMTRAYLAVEKREKAQGVVAEMMGRGYPSAVVTKVVELLGGGEQESVAAAL
ncbi:Pentatricopeptide repeat-containing protein 5, mitochondrial [Cytospora mali]|uniref:Pentatricopeptide repeat-containing protein 5, mitochondrial n=1 Tax=Cytospora mali TaxID=578113 RepID=A0A194US66_CYTMA|nr:Pentatricopeptide repeat-containing protein 5, mitochondrial [Valsa mali var. pyri (nom. inval.)]